MRGYLGVASVKDLPGGSNFAFQTSGDHWVEVNDSVKNVKWRFAPRKGQCDGYGPGFVVLAELGLIASIDPDAVRFWKVPIQEEE